MVQIPPVAGHPFGPPEHFFQGLQTLQADQDVGKLPKTMRRRASFLGGQTKWEVARNPYSRVRPPRVFGRSFSFGQEAARGLLFAAEISRLQGAFEVGDRTPQVAGWCSRVTWPPFSTRSTCGLNGLDRLSLLFWGVAILDTLRW